MSGLNALFAELCPEGVEFMALREAIDYEQPGRYLVAQASYNDAHATPVLTAGQTFILGYTNEEAGIYPASPSAPVVIFDDFTTAFKWVDFPFKAKSSAMKILTPKPGVEVCLRYVWHAMQLIKYQPQDHARQWIGTYSLFRIPIPPLAVQREIAKLLDTFLRGHEELQSELQAEMWARARQYTHYRDTVLSFVSRVDASWQPMGEVGEFFRGRRFTKGDYVEDGIPAIHYGEIYTDYGTFASEARARVRSEMRGSLRFAKPGDVVIAGVGETVEDVGKAVAWLGDQDVAIHDDCFAYRHEMNPKFVAYYFQTERFHRELARHVARAKVKRISAKALAVVPIPVIPRDEQERVVGILDRFEALVTDLSFGLPAEIAARRKQYEYYRDLLLTFPEKTT